MVVQHNLTAFNSNRMLGLTNSSLAKSAEKLSSGYRVNRAADDAAGLAISEKMRRQIRGLTQASANCQDGVSLCQIADGALNEVHEMLKRCEELAIKAANDTNTTEDRDYIQMELDALASEIDRVHETTVFNNQNIFSNNGITPGAVAPNLSGLNNVSVLEDGSLSFVTDSGIKVEVGFVASDATHILTTPESNAVGEDNTDDVKNSSLAAFAQKAAANAVNLLSQKYPVTFTSSVSKNIKVGLELRNDKVGGTLATASMQISSNGTSTIMSYSMFIDTADYPIDQFDSFTDAQKADLASVIAHEMTHLMMYDTSTDGMLNGRTTSFPEWFVEGIAQTSSGDNGWVSNHINPSSTEQELKNYMSQLYSKPYGAGYVATMYLGLAAFEKSENRKIDDIVSGSVNSTAISKGLDIILSNFVKHVDAGNVQQKTLDDIIREYTDFDGLADFENKFRTGSETAVKFTDYLLDARGTNGAGSILYDLNKSESSAFDPGTLINSYGTYDTFKIQTDNKFYGNAYGSGYTFPEKGSIIGGGGQGGGNGNGFILQVGAEKDQYIHVDQYNISASALFSGHRMDVTGEYVSPDSSVSDSASNPDSGVVANGDAASRANTIDLIKEADRRVSLIRSYYGATQNRLEHTIKNLDNIVENTTAAESQIRDTDMASEMVRYSNSNILAQAGQSMLAQANQSNQGILSLLS